MKCTDCKHWYCDFDLEEKPKEGEPIRCQQEWEYCVSTGPSIMSLYWNEYFFLNREEAAAFERGARKRGLVTMMVSRDEY